MSYNGWKNYETWVVGMYLDGNYDGEETYKEIGRITEYIAQHASEDSNVADGIWTVEEARKFRLADSLKHWVEATAIDPARDAFEFGLAADLLGAAFSEVDWDELAENKLSALEEV